MTYISEDHFNDLRDRYRDRMLDASDKAMNELASAGTLLKFTDNLSGSRDADLPELFKALDAQFILNLAHGGVLVMTDEDAGSQAYQSRIS